MLSFKPVFTIDEPALDAMLNQPQGHVGRWLRRKGRIMEAAAKRDVGVKTGRLRAGIYRSHSRVPRGQKMVIGARSAQAKGRLPMLHHEGSRPHVIIGGVGEELTFMSRGRLISKKVVRHPGSKPNKFLTAQFKYLLTP